MAVTLSPSAPRAVRSPADWLRGGFSAAVAVLFSAALYGLAFAPLPGAWAAAWVALALFFAAVASASPLRAAALGLGFGMAAALATCWWLPEMLVRFFGMSPLMGWLASLGCYAAFGGVYFAALASWLAWLVRRGPVPLFAVAVGFVACEWARASWLVPNPQALLAYSQIELRPLAQLAELAGPWGIGFLLAAVNALVAGVVAPTSSRPSSASVRVIRVRSTMRARERRSLRSPSAPRASFDVRVPPGCSSAATS